MTKNRARIRATKALAASSDIRHPDASYLADHRKLRLPDGTIHDFSDGPLRLIGTPGSGAEAAALGVEKEAKGKGWGTDHYTESMATLGLAPQNLRWSMRPSLIIVNFHYETSEVVQSAVEDLAAGAYPDLNVLIVRDPIPGESLQDPANGRNVYLATASPALITGGPGSGRNADIRAQIEATDAAREALNALGIPEAAQRFATESSGLFLVTGMTGAGKTMTAATLLRRAYYAKGHAAAAIMLPCEMLIADYPGVTFHEAEHANETAAAIRKAVADGSKIILVDTLLGDPESTEAVLDAALGGALVIVTMHTKASDAAQRLLDAFPDSGNKKIRAKVQLALRGVIEQVLVRGESGTGRVLASEVWVEDDSDGDLAPVLTFQDSLEALVAEGTVLQPDADKAAARRW